MVSRFTDTPDSPGAGEDVTVVTRGSSARDGSVPFRASCKLVYPSPSESLAASEASNGFSTVGRVNSYTSSRPSPSESSGAPRETRWMR